MTPHWGRSALRLACFITVTALLLLFLTSPGTAEFVVTVMTLGVGVVFLVVVIVWMRR